MELLAFLGLIIIISFSGVLMPGPMTAATIVRSYKDKWAGAKVAIGHALVEFPLLAIIAVTIITLGAGAMSGQDNTLVLIIGLVGGAYLFYFGIT
ncbi:MAG: LysE family transporter, partial [Thermoplasmata archaeon]|nr:LysE family transporter [Thermoplasmata archaeon]